MNTPSYLRMFSALVLILLAQTGWAEMPDLQPIDFQVPAAITCPPGALLSCNYTIANRGDMPALSLWQDRIYVSTKETFDASAVLAGYGYGTTMLEELCAQTYNVRFPLLATNPGVYYLFLKVDANGQISESNELNNELSRIITFNPGYPDLAIGRLEVPSKITGSAPPKISYSITFTNGGAAALQVSSWINRFYWSKDAVFDTSDVSIKSFSASPSIPAGGTLLSQGEMTLSMLKTNASGWILLVADSGRSVPETERGNNTLAVPFSFELLPPDLQPIGLTLTNSSLVSAAPPTVAAVFTLTNAGPGSLGSEQRLTYQFSLSTNASRADAVTLEQFSYWGPLAAGKTKALTQSITLPITASRRYYLFLETDPTSTVVESDESNNLISIPIDFDIRKHDLAILPGLTHTNAIGAQQPVISVPFSVTNATVLTADGWYAGIYFSTDPVLDSSDTLLDHTYRNLAPGLTIDCTRSVRLPVFQSGRYYLIEKADDGGLFSEHDETNNIQVLIVDLTVLLPDLEPVSLQAPAVYSGPSGGQFPVTYTVTNHSPAISLDQLSWSEEICIATNGILDANSIVLNSRLNSAPAGGLSVSTITNNVAMPGNVREPARLFVRINPGQSPIEINASNNVIGSPLGIEITPPDLRAIPASVPNPFTGPPTPLLSLAWGLTNVGAGAAVHSRLVEVYLSSNATLETGDSRLISSWNSTPLAPGASLMFEDLVTLPLTSSFSGYLIFVCHEERETYDAVGINSQVAAPIRVVIEPLDLVPLPILFPPQISGPPQPTATVVWGISNAGPGMLEGKRAQVVSTLSLSRNTNYEVWDKTLSQINLYSNLAPGAVVWFTNNLTLPITNSGNWHLLARTDPVDSFLEGNELNNILAQPFSAVIHYPDLAAAPLSAPSYLEYTPNSQVSVIIAATNIATVALVPGSSWNDKIWISRQPYLDSSAFLLKTTVHSGILAPGKGYAHQELLTLPITESGIYYLIAEVGASLSWDVNASNNLTIKPLNVQVSAADLQPLSLLLSLSSSVLPHPVAEVVTGITNQGAGAAYSPNGRYDSMVLSKDAVLDASDPTVATYYINEAQPAQSMVYHTNHVGLPITESGNYYLFWIADSRGTIPELSEQNNSVMSAISLTVTPPDLAPIRFELPTTLSGPPNPWVPVVCTITNLGSGRAQGRAWKYVAYPVGMPNNAFSLSYVHAEIPAAGALSFTNYMRLPFSESSSFDLVFEVNPDQWLFEGSYSNNTITNRVTFNAELPNLAPTRLTAPAVWTIPEDESLIVSYGVTNVGPGIAVPAPAWLDQLFFSTDPLLSEDDFRCAEIASPKARTLASGETYWQSVNLSFRGVAPGALYLLLVVNTDHSLIETTTTDNVLAIPITVRERKPDLAPLHLIAPTVVTNPLGYITCSWYVVNQGLGEVRRDSSWQDLLMLSPSSNIDYETTTLSSVIRGAPLPVGTGYWVTNKAWLSLTNDGDHFLLLQTGQGTDMNESAVANNTIAVPVRVRLAKPDLAVVGIDLPSSLSADPGAPIEVRWGITNAGLGATRPDSPIKATFTCSPGEGGNVNFYIESPALPPGGAAFFTNSFALPAAFTNTLAFSVSIDPWSEQVEITRTNNQVNRAIPWTPQYPELEITMVSFPSNLVCSPNQPIQLVYAVTNIGPGTALARRWDTITITNLAGQTFGPTTIYWETNRLAAGEGCLVTGEFRMAFYLRSGPAVAHVTINNQQLLPELDSGNNTVEIPMQLDCRTTDLIAGISILATNAVGTAAPSVLVRWELTNSGPEDFFAWSQTRIGFSISTSSNGSFPPMLELPMPPFIPAGTSVAGTNAIPFFWTGKGLRFVVMNADSYGELMSANNRAAAPVDMIDQLDLMLSDLIAPSALNGAPNQRVIVIARVLNRGIWALRPGWNYSVSLGSPYFGFGNDINLFFSGSISNGVLPGESVWFTNVIALPPLAAGNYAWRAQVWPMPPYEDGNSANDIHQLPVQVNLSRPSQLRVLSLSADAQATSTNPIAQVRWSIVNEGDGPAAFNWVDSVYYSLDNRFTLDDTLVASRPNLAGLASGGTYSWQTTAALPNDAKSGAFLVLVADRDSSLWDEVLANNSATTVLRIAPAKSEPTWLSEPRFIDGRFQASLHGPAGQSVVLQVSTNLVDWESLRALTFESEDLDIEDTNSGGSAPRFYRLIPLSELD